MLRAPVGRWETVIQVAFTVLSNASMLPGARLCWTLGLHLDSIIACFCIMTSLSYHILEIIEGKALGGDAGRWHVADNVFAISAFCFAWINFLQVTTRVTIIDALKLVALCVNVIAQVIGPWDLRYTYIPISFWMISVIVASILGRRKPRIDYWWAGIALSSLLASVLFFTLGLDDDKDYLRMYHGCWHIAVSAFMYSVVKASNPPDLVHARRQAQKAANSHFIKYHPEYSAFGQIDC